MAERPTQTPGWYYAQGDPPGTHRYWDGVQWQGGPQPVATTAAALTADMNASPGKRFVAALIDYGILVGIYVVGTIFAAVLDSAAIFYVFYITCNVIFPLYNFVYLQGTTGQTIGKRSQGTALQKNGQPPGMLMAFARYLLIGVFSIPCWLDNWWILVDENNRRLSDRVLDMDVFEV